MKDDTKYFERDLSWVEFNRRVFAESQDEQNPVLERLKFLGIVSLNFDEFFMIRVACARHQSDRLADILDKAYDLMRQQHDYFNETILPELAKSKIKRCYPAELSPDQIDYIHKLFVTEIYPLLTPIAFHQDAQVPSLKSLMLHTFFQLAHTDKKDSRYYAVIEIPRKVSRIILLPGSDDTEFVFAEDIISHFAGLIFKGYEIIDSGLFRITRIGEFAVDESRDEDLASMMAEAVKSRRQNDIIRIEIMASDTLSNYLKWKFDLEDTMIFEPTGWMDLKSVSQLAFQSGRDEFKRPAWTPRPCRDFQDIQDVWTLLKEKDVIIHHPYESFDAVIYYLSSAADDPDVLAIKQTLYRTAGDSAIVAALERAAENGKQVTVLVELKARFDEENNIQWARRLARAGVTILYGVEGLKTHAKACLVVRREPEGIKRYLHLGTGNYNEKTAELYSDIGLFTSDEVITKDVSSFFNVITGYSQPVGLTKIEISPYTIRPRLKRLIMREAMLGRKDQEGLIIAKMNSLVDEEIIEALYQASKAGVKILLNVRGICRLRPGVKGLSENIRVVSIVDMFLEHSRIFYFYNNGDDEIFLSSADWMTRNLDRRLEIMFPVEDGKIKSELLEILNLYFKDNMKSWELLADGNYRKNSPEDKKKFRVQEYLCKKAAQQEKGIHKAALREIRPKKPAY